jgi:hypothetical protein
MRVPMRIRRSATVFVVMGVAALGVAPAGASTLTQIAEPTVTSVEYPADGTWHPGAGVPGSFTFGADGDGAVVGFYYGNFDPASTFVAADQPGGTATISYTPAFSGPNDLYVASVDSAGNRSPQHVHHFYVQSTEPGISGPHQTGVGIPAEFGFTARIADVVSYTYKVDNGPESTVPAVADGTTTADVVTADIGSHTLSVWSTTGAGLKSGTATWSYVAREEPLVTSEDYPEYESSGGPGIPGVFTLTPRMLGVVDYVYYLFEDWDNPTVVPAGPDGRATFTFTPAASGFYPMQVYSRTADGTSSRTGRDYYVIVSP